MEHSTELGDLFKALSALQGDLSGVKRDSSNPFFKSSYASLDAVLRVVNPALGKHGLCLTQWPDGEVLRTMLGHESGQWISADYPIHPVKPDPQGVGSAITYARRYAAMAVLGVAPEDDDGEAGSGRSSKSAKAVQPKQVAAPEEDHTEFTAEKRRNALARAQSLAIDLISEAGDGLPEEIMQKTVGEVMPAAKLSDDQLVAFGKALAAELARHKKGRAA